MLQAKGRSRQAQKYVSQERAAIIMQAAYYRWHAYKVAERRREKAAVAFAMGTAGTKPEYQVRAARVEAHGVLGLPAAATHRTYRAPPRLLPHPPR